MGDMADWNLEQDIPNPDDDWFELCCPTCAIEYEGYGDPPTECPNCGTELIGEEDML